jgi:hypothetical protein
MQKYGLSGWYNDILGIVLYFGSSDVLNTLGSGSWISWANANVLEAVQNGMVIYQGQHLPVGENRGAAGLWAEFIAAARDDPSKSRSDLIQLHWIAEQAGAENAAIEADLMVGRPGGLEGRLINSFANAVGLFRNNLASQQWFHLGHPHAAQLTDPQYLALFFGGAHLIEDLVIADYVNDDAQRRVVCPIWTGC